MKLFKIRTTINQIKNYQKYFSKEKILFMISEELRSNTREVLNKIIDFLEVNVFNFPKIVQFSKCKTKKERMIKT